jgi:hypothetical protein
MGLWKELRPLNQGTLALIHWNYGQVTSPFWPGEVAIGDKQMSRNLVVMSYSCASSESVVNFKQGTCKVVSAPLNHALKPLAKNTDPAILVPRIHL